MLISCLDNADAVFVEVCARFKWKRTVQRRTVFTCLCGNRTHPSVEAVWRDTRKVLPDVSLDSIYRILDDFAAAGLVQKLVGAGIARYDADTSAHGHFICDKCGELFDFAFMGGAGLLRECAEVGEMKSFEVTVRGTCRDCLKMNQSLQNTVD